MDPSKVHHVFHCDDTPNKAWAKMNDPRRIFMDLNRFGFYYERFQKYRKAFDESISKLPFDFREAIREEKGGASIIEVIESFFVSVKEARRTLCWAFAFRYFMKEDSLDQRRFMHSMHLLEDLINLVMLGVSLQHGPKGLFRIFSNKDGLNVLNTRRGAMDRYVE